MMEEEGREHFCSNKGNHIIFFACFLEALGSKPAEHLSVKQEKEYK
jgi:hypothetical protein